MDAPRRVRCDSPRRDRSPLMIPLLSTANRSYRSLRDGSGFAYIPGDELPGFYEAAFVKRALRKSFLPFLVYFSAQFGNSPALTGFCAANKVRGTSALFAAQKSVTSLAGSLDTSSGQRNKWQGLAFCGKDAVYAG